MRSKGCAQLLATGWTQAKVARALGCSDALVGHWLRGMRLPAPQWREVMSGLFDIPVGAWDLPVHSWRHPVASVRERISRELEHRPLERARVLGILEAAGIR